MLSLRFIRQTVFLGDAKLISIERYIQENRFSSITRLELRSIERNKVVYQTRKTMFDLIDNHRREES